MTPWCCRRHAFGMLPWAGRKATQRICESQSILCGAELSGHGLRWHSDSAAHRAPTLASCRPAIHELIEALAGGLSAYGPATGSAVSSRLQVTAAPNSARGGSRSGVHERGQSFGSAQLIKQALHALLVDIAQLKGGTSSLELRLTQADKCREESRHQSSSSLRVAHAGYHRGGEVHAGKELANASRGLSAQRPGCLQDSG